MTFREELAALLNKFDWDTRLNMPDHALAEKIEIDLESMEASQPEEPPTDGPVIEIPGDAPHPGGN